MPLLVPGSWEMDMLDAAFAENMSSTSAKAFAGYFGGPRAYHVWGPADWDRFKGRRKLPIWVGGMAGAKEGQAAVTALKALGVPKGAWTVNDMEMRVDRTYLDNYYAVLADAGYRVWVYGSASTVFHNPQLDGYWVADYAGIGPYMYDAGPGAEVRATQYASGAQADMSSVKPWTLYNTKWWDS